VRPGGVPIRFPRDGHPRPFFNSGPRLVRHSNVGKMNCPASWGRTLIAIAAAIWLKTSPLPRLGMRDLPRPPGALVLCSGASFLLSRALPLFAAHNVGGWEPVHTVTFRDGLPILQRYSRMLFRSGLRPMGGAKCSEGPGASMGAVIVLLVAVAGRFLRLRPYSPRFFNSAASGFPWLLCFHDRKGKISAFCPPPLWGPSARAVWS